MERGEGREESMDRGQRRALVKQTASEVHGVRNHEEVKAAYHFMLVHSAIDSIRSRQTCTFAPVAHTSDASVTNRA